MLTRLALLVTATLFALHFALVVKYAVDVPYLDEWEALRPAQLGKELSIRWLFQQHNEHRIVPTKLLTWALYRWNGWDIAINQQLNFLIYGILITTILFVVYRFVSREAFSIATLFAPFLLSTINYENHLWGFQSPFHFFLLFFVIGTFLLFDHRQRAGSFGLGLLAIIASMLSLASGVVCAIVVTVMFVFFKANRMQWERSLKPLEFGQAFLVLMVLCVALAGWFWAFTNPSHGVPLTFPWQGNFWKHFLNVLSLGFGWDSLSLLPGMLCLVIVLTPTIAVLVSNLRGEGDAAVWACATVILGIIASLAAISMGRAGLGMEQAKSSRYSEIGMILIPFTAVLWGTLLSGRHRASQILVIGSFWLLCFVVFRNNFRYQMYPHTYDVRQQSLECLFGYYDHPAPTECRLLYGGDLSPRLERARELNVSFYRHYVRLRALPGLR